jgi:hypothetical protein
MTNYSVFGGSLRTDVPFPELPPSASEAFDWEIRTAEPGFRLPEPEEGSFLGDDGIIGPVRARMYTEPDGGYRLVYTHWNVGSFVVSAEGRRILWVPEEDPILDAARLCLLARVMAAALHASGTLCLHGSAVAFEHGAVAFLAPKFHGKSTAAAALVRAGARLATDDVVPIELGEPVMIRPGVPRLRLWKDSAQALATDMVDLPAATDDKVYLDGLPAERVMSAPEPLQAIYIITPVTADREPGQAAARHRLDGIQALLAVLRNASLGPLLERGSVQLLERVDRVTRSVPVYSLEVARDLNRLPEVVERLFAWHSAGVPRPGGPALDPAL